MNDFDPTCQHYCRRLHLCSPDLRMIKAMTSRCPDFEPYSYFTPAQEIGLILKYRLTVNEDEWQIQVGRSSDMRLLQMSKSCGMPSWIPNASHHDQGMPRALTSLSSLWRQKCQTMTFNEKIIFAVNFAALGSHQNVFLNIKWQPLWQENVQVLLWHTFSQCQIVLLPDTNWRFQRMEIKCCFWCIESDEKCSPESQMTVKMVNQCREFLPWIVGGEKLSRKYKLTGDNDEPEI